MQPDLERIVSEDEVQRAAVDAAASRARARLESERARIEAGREARLAARRREIDAEVEGIAAAAEREATSRRERRQRFSRDRRAAAAGVMTEAAEVYLRFVRDGPPVKARP